MLDGSFQNLFEVVEVCHGVVSKELPDLDVEFQFLELGMLAQHPFVDFKDKQIGKLLFLFHLVGYTYHLLTSLLLCC